jgi:FMN-dependent NADH-azoreductase
VVKQILHLDASHRREGSVSRALSAALIAELTARYPAAAVVRRVLAAGTPLVDDAWINANDTPEDQRMPEQADALAASDAMVAELRDSDLWVIGTPVYNFSLPPVLKAWVDQICRARVTFAYSEQGPRGLLADRKVFLAIASGGSRIGSPTEFLTPYVAARAGLHRRPRRGGRGGRSAADGGRRENHPGTRADRPGRGRPVTGDASYSG